MLRYGESRSQKPDCYGRESYFNTRDPDCQRCDFFDDCADEIKSRRRGSSSVRSVYPRREERSNEVLKAKTHAGIVQEGESPGGRFLRDCLTGACRGAAWEAYEFFCQFRF